MGNLATISSIFSGSMPISPTFSERIISVTWALGALVVQIWAWVSPTLRASATSARPYFDPYVFVFGVDRHHLLTFTSMPCPTEP